MEKRAIEQPEVEKRLKRDDWNVITEYPRGALIRIRERIISREDEEKIKTTLETLLAQHGGQDQGKMFGKSWTSRRRTLQLVDSPSTKIYRYNGSRNTNPHRVLFSDVPEICQVIEKITEYAGRRPSMALVNYYFDGSVGLGGHHDNEKQLEGSIFCLTLLASPDSSPRVVRFYDSDGVKYDLQPRSGSLYEFNKSANEHYLHCVPPDKTYHGPRLSVTFRFYSTKQ